MNRIRTIWLNIMLTGTLLTVFTGTEAWSQSPGQYRLVTDRSLYAAGEGIRFRVFNLNVPGIRDQGWSTVYYLELIAPRGNALVSGKWSLNGRGASGSLQIPRDLPSGTYYLKGYTRWMKNEGAAAFQYLSLEIINPYRRELLPADTVSPSTVELRLQEAGIRKGEALVAMPAGSYTPGERITMTLLRALGSNPLDCSVSVAERGAMEGQRESLPVSPGVEPREVAYLPETRGITLSGSVTERGTNEPAPYAVVYLSSLGGDNEFYATYADGQGKFYFALNDGEGETDYFISSSLEERTDVALRVDQDFSAEQVALPSYPLRSVRSDPEVVRRMALNAQVRDQYRTAAPPQMGTGPEVNGRWFYGTPDVTVRFGDFIQLPALEEYFNEVIPQVALRRNGGSRSMSVRGPHPDLQYFPPLVMVDGVAVFDVASVLEISPRAVDRVEIVTAPYIRGNVTFGGIVHLITTNGNMGTMDLPASGLLITFRKFTPEQDTEPAGEQPGHPLPDVRNTLYWNPSVSLVPGEARTLSFDAPDAPGEYEIRITGVDPGGSFHGERHRFRVEQEDQRR